MYNGIGLSTPRGSGTSGHVQRNSASVHKKDKLESSEKNRSELINRPPNKEILEHTRKREIELKCLELSDTLEEQGYKEEEIETKVQAYRKILVENYEKMYNSKPSDESGRPKVKDSHESAKAQIERNSTLKDALGLSSSDEKSSESEDELQLAETKCKKIKH